MIAMRRALLGLALLALCWLGGCGGPAPRVADDDGPRARLRWEARNEKGVYGYLVYRSASREGPFRRVSPDIVRAREGGRAETHRYEYVDRQVRAGATYYYYLDVVGTDGRKRRFSGVVQKTVDSP